MLSDEDMLKVVGSFSPDRKAPLLTGTVQNPFPSYTDAADAVSASMLHDRVMQQMAARKREYEQLGAFKEAYVKIRSSNVALDHHTAIALVKMIYQDADRLTIEDFA